MINYISKFVENFSKTTAPLRELLHNDVEWCWQDRHQKTFEALKRAITNPPVLAYYVKKPVTLTCDASKSGLGAACLQEGRPVAYASRALTETEHNYAQIEKELLAVVFACKRFDDFVYGRPIEVETDHKPLVTILNKPLCAAPMRLQKMMLTLYRYNINITYKQGKELHIADALSRAYLPETNGGETTQYEVMTVFPISDTRKKQLQNAITTDKTSLQLTKLVQEGWPNTIKKVPKAARDFYPFRDEPFRDRMIVKGTRVIIPISLHQEYLTELHRGHPGAEGMKRRVRNTVYWPNINEEVDRHVSMCSTCNKHKSHQQKELLKQLPAPELPWSIVASDVFELDGNSYLIIVDSYSGWWEIEKMTNTTSTSVITQMKRHFATHGIPVTLYTDNGQQYVSEKFKAFTNEWEFNHKTSSPYYPQSNGLAERTVQSAKSLLKKTKDDGTDFYLALLSWRNTAATNALGSPSQRLMSRQTRSKLPVMGRQLRPMKVKHVTSKLKHLRNIKKKHYDKSAKPLAQLKRGQTVRMQTTSGYDTKGKIVELANRPRSYLVKSCDNDRVYERNRL